MGMSEELAWYKWTRDMKKAAAKWSAEIVQYNIILIDGCAAYDICICDQDGWANKTIQRFSKFIIWTEFLD